MKKIILALGATLFVSAAAQAEPISAADGQVFLDGLHAPQGIMVRSDGSIIVTESGAGGDQDLAYFNPQSYAATAAKVGPSSRVHQVSADGTVSVLAALPSVAVEHELIGAARSVEVDGRLFVTTGAWQEALGVESTVDNYPGVVEIHNDGSVSLVGDTWAHELTHNPDGTGNKETHPYDLMLGAAGDVLIVDAAANTLLSLDTTSGAISTMAVFEGMPGVFPNPFRNNEPVSDPVPTGLAMGPDGSVLASLLSGAPFIPGSAKIVSVKDGEVSDYATGLTMAVDMATALDGTLYVLSFGLFEPTGPVPASGSVHRIHADGRSEMVVDGLSFATSIEFAPDGAMLVAINGVMPVAGQILRFEQFM